MDELESTVATALLAREARAPEPREGLACAVLSGAVRRRRRHRVSYCALGAAVAAAVAVPLLVGAGVGKSASGPPARPGPVTNDAVTGDARDHYTATLECYPYQHEGGDVPIGRGAVGRHGPRSAIEAWWRSADDLPLDWNSDVVVEQTDIAATEVITRMDQTVAAVVELSKKPDGWHVMGVDACL
jgi:poly(3-hydroxybutyrate) depolymerase